MTMAQLPYFHHSAMAAQTRKQQVQLTSAPKRPLPIMVWLLFQSDKRMLCMPNLPATHAMVWCGPDVGWGGDDMMSFGNGLSAVVEVLAAVAASPLSTAFTGLNFSSKQYQRIRKLLTFHHMSTPIRKLRLLLYLATKTLMLDQYGVKRHHITIIKSIPFVGVRRCGTIYLMKL